MANTTVTKVSEMMLTNVTAGVKAGEQKISDAGGFGQVMNNAKGTSAKTNDNPKDSVKASRTVVDKPSSKEIKSGDTVKKDPVANKEDKEMFTEEVAKETSGIMDKIKKVLDVSDEELETAMENLGITPVDLLNPASVRELCMELEGVEDSISLLTNADLYESIKEIAGAAEEAGNKMIADFGTDEADVSELLKDESFVSEVKEAITKLENKAPEDDFASEAAAMALQQSAENIGTPETDMDVEDHAAVAADIRNTDAAAGTEAKAVTVEVEGRYEESSSEGATTANSSLTGQSTATETFKAAPKSEESGLKGNNEGLENASRFVQSESVAAPSQTVVTTEVNNLGQVVETVTSYSNADANSIMSQVTQSIRVNYSADTTSMEMQLHPASLGTVNMQIASNNGVVTAHILVQSEAVKAALESQLITLQQTFEEQGQRVEAVEVSVANYDLNRGTNSDSDANDREGAARAGRSGSRRRINLNDLADEDIEELSDEERISADMMARSGNSVDYTA